VGFERRECESDLNAEKLLLDDEGKRDFRMGRAKVFILHVDSITTNANPLCLPSQSPTYSHTTIDPGRRKPRPHPQYHSTIT
jgi:hypothetical protein